MKLRISLALLTLIVLSCKKDPPAEDGVALDETPYDLSIGAFPPPPIASDNQLTVQKVQLGRMLFYEKKLSRDNSQSCASCHRQEHAFTDTAKFSIGVLGFEGKRQAMSSFNMAWNTNEFFWDGRAHLLRDQSLLPIQDSLEMHETLPNVVEKLQADPKYRDQFVRAFGTDEISSEWISLALEQFMNSIVSVNSKYDRFLAGLETLTESEARGKKLFFTEYNQFFPDSSGADCAHCHSGLNFSNNQYMNNGMDSDPDMTDFGREKATMDPMDRGKFKVVSLRNIAVTAPYMHDGRFSTLEEVIEHYNSGLKASTTLDQA
ncbi:MAG: cytochrome-c peroxidase, partial [Bacteroidota bacterium]|nr:cytochrome-c peroxidase [Bacteroidota bacterium]